MKKIMLSTLAIISFAPTFIMTMDEFFIIEEEELNKYENTALYEFGFFETLTETIINTLKQNKKISFNDLKDILVSKAGMINFYDNVSSKFEKNLSKEEFQKIKPSIYIDETKIINHFMHKLDPGMLKYYEVQDI